MSGTLYVGEYTRWDIVMYKKSDACRNLLHALLQKVKNLYFNYFFDLLMTALIFVFDTKKSYVHFL